MNESQSRFETFPIAWRDREIRMVKREIGLQSKIISQYKFLLPRRLGTSEHKDLGILCIVFGCYTEVSIEESTMPGVVVIYVLIQLSVDPLKAE